MKHHGTVIMFVLIFGLAPATLASRACSNLDCDRFQDVKGFVCEDAKMAATQVMYVIITISIMVCLVFAVDYFRIRDRVVEPEYSKQPIRRTE